MTSLKYYNKYLIELGSDFVQMVSPEVEGFKKRKTAQMKRNQMESEILPTELAGLTRLPVYIQQICPKWLYH